MGTPNLLFLMCDQMQYQAFADPLCITPNLDRLRARGTECMQTYTPCAVCSPARASLMTGLLPHNHGVLFVTHTADDDQACLRTDFPHWAMRLREQSWHTAYFGKWHIERSIELDRFGWEINLCRDTKMYRELLRRSGIKQPKWLLRKELRSEGYDDVLLYGITEQDAQQREMGFLTDLACNHLRGLSEQTPWCCMVSYEEPHDPYVCGQSAFSRYESVELPLPAADDCYGKPGIYRKARRPFRQLSAEEHETARKCYYASITELDEQIGRILDVLEQRNDAENTIIVFTTDHGDLLGAHGMYCKNFSAAEEIYHIPMLISGPGVSKNHKMWERVGLHDLCDTILELCGCEPFGTTDGTSFTRLLKDGTEERRTQGYAEYYGGRFLLTQRVYWEKNWKYVLNGFDEDELYDLSKDPQELCNLAADPNFHGKVVEMLSGLWRNARKTGDHSICNTSYPIMRIEPVGPDLRKG